MVTSLAIVPARRKMSVMGRVVNFRAPAMDVWVCMCVCGGGGVGDGGGS